MILTFHTNQQKCIIRGIDLDAKVSIDVDLNILTLDQRKYLSEQTENREVKNTLLLSGATTLDVQYVIKEAIAENFLQLQKEAIKLNSVYNKMMVFGDKIKNSENATSERFSLVYKNEKGKPTLISNSKVHLRITYFLHSSLFTPYTTSQLESKKIQSILELTEKINEKIKIDAIEKSTPLLLAEAEKEKEEKEKTKSEWSNFFSQQPEIFQRKYTANLISEEEIEQAIICFFGIVKSLDLKPLPKNTDWEYCNYLTNAEFESLESLKIPNDVKFDIIKTDHNSIGVLIKIIFAGYSLEGFIWL